MMVVVQRLRRSVPSSLSRCRSAGGTWTTTTSATGMPSLDTEPPPSSRRPPHLAGAADARRVSTPAVGYSGRPRLLTSDYESSDSPSSSEHGERSSSTSSRRDAAVPDTTDDVDHDVSPSPSPPPSFPVRLSTDQVCLLTTVTGQLAATPTRGLPTRGLDNSRSRRCRQLVSWSLTSLFSTNMAISETNRRADAAKKEN